MRLKLALFASALALSFAAGALAQHGRPGGPPDDVVDRVQRAQARAAEASDRAQQQAAQAAERAQEQAGRAAERAGTRASEAVDRAQGHATDAAERAQAHASQAAERVSDEASDAVERAQAQAAAGKARGAEASASAPAQPGYDDSDYAGTQTAQQKAQARALVAAYPDRLELTRLGAAVRGELVMVAPSASEVAQARAAGFAIAADETIAGLDLRSVTLRAPQGMSLEAGLTRLRAAAPRAEITANYIHYPSGGAIASVAAAPLAPPRAVARPRLGMIDGGVARHPSLAGPIEQKAFKPGGPTPSAHGTAIASLLVGSAPMRGVDPGAGLLVADVYGASPAGGDSLALARALGWMVQRRAAVVLMSLVGPPDPLLGRAVRQAETRGALIVAPVGNFGPAAPPAFPASYAGVIAVTAVNARNRVLVEAGRSLHLDYAAPGSDMAAALPTGGLGRVRGTSFAAALVAGRLSALPGRGGTLRAELDREADRSVAAAAGRPIGRGLVCGRCRTPIR